MREEFFSGLHHGSTDLVGQLLLELIKCRPNLFLGATGLVDFQNPSFKVYPRANRPEDLIRRTEDTLKEPEFLVEEFINTSVRSILAIDKVQDHYIVFLPITVTAADPLLNPLRVPGEVIIHCQVAELEVEPFGPSLGGDENLCPSFKFIDKSFAKGCLPGETGRWLFILTFLFPESISPLSDFPFITPAKKGDLVTIAIMGKKA